MQLALTLSALFLAIVLHEIAHGYVAFLCGDDTAKREKRLSLNPINHIDYIGTIVVPLMLFLSSSGFVFGWAKPVPVNYRNLRKTRRDIILVSSAGIVANLILAFISALVLRAISPFTNPVMEVMGIGFLAPFALYNIILAVFNLLPIPPLDGSKILFTFINKSWGYKYLANERIGFGIIIIAGIIIPTLLARSGIDFDPLKIYIQKLSIFLIKILP